MKDGGYSVFDSLFELTREHERAFIRIERLASQLAHYEEMSRPELFRSVLHDSAVYEHLLNEENKSVEFMLRAHIGMLISTRLNAIRDELALGNLWATGILDGALEPVDIPQHLWPVLTLAASRNTAVSDETSHSFSGVRIFLGPKSDASTGIDIALLNGNAVADRKPGRPSNWDAQIISIHEQRRTRGVSHTGITAEAKEILKIIERTSAGKDVKQLPALVTVKKHIRPFFARRQMALKAE